MLRYPLPWNYYENNSLRIIFVVLEGSCALKISGKERLFQGIARETRNFSKFFISENFYIGNNFVPESMFENQQKGLIRTKNATTIEQIANYSGIVYLLPPPPYLLRCGPFFEKKNACNSLENGVRTRRAAIVDHSATANYSAIVNPLPVVTSLRVLSAPKWLQFKFLTDLKNVSVSVVFAISEFLLEFRDAIVIRGFSQGTVTFLENQFG